MIDDPYTSQDILGAVAWCLTRELSVAIHNGSVVIRQKNGTFEIREMGSGNLISRHSSLTGAVLFIRDRLKHDLLAGWLPC